MGSILKSWDNSFIRKSDGVWTASEEYDAAGYGSCDEALADLKRFHGIAIDSVNPKRHPLSELLLVSDITPTAAGYGRWMIRVDYSTNRLGAPIDAENPLSAPAIYEWATGLESLYVDRDGFGNPVRNAAADAFPMQEATGQTKLWFTISRVEPSSILWSRSNT